MRSGRLLDPRLTIICTDEDAVPVGFVWINPDRRAHWITVESGGWIEVYPVVAGEPVRVTTGDVEIHSSSATFDVVQYDEGGKTVARQSLRAAVAG
jgi:hypothetical protein